MKFHIWSFISCMNLISIPSQVYSQGEAMESLSKPGESCEFPDKSRGVCEPLSLCLLEVKDSTVPRWSSVDGVLKRGDTILRCALAEQEIHVCCRKPKEIAKKLCNVWSQYWRAVSVSTNNTCPEETRLIHGGEEATYGEFPHMAAIGRKERGEDHFECGGSLITPQHVMTAAHCINLDHKDRMVVALGEHNLQQRSTRASVPILDFGLPEGLNLSEPVTTSGFVEIEQKFKVSEIFVHPHYPKWYNDIALLKLDRPAALTRYVLPACLATGFSSIHADELTFTAAGWGALRYEGEMSDTLQKVDLKFKDTVTCLKEFNIREGGFGTLPFGITSDMFCAGEPGKDSCGGDSGGPLMENPKAPCGPRKVTGIVSFGPACGALGIYIKVASYLDWITGIVAPGLVQNHVDILGFFMTLFDIVENYENSSSDSVS